MLLKSSFTLGNFRMWLQLANVQTFEALLCSSLDIEWLQSLVIISMHFSSRISMESLIKFEFSGAFELLN